jgi:hypothetical protein
VALALALLGRPRTASPEDLQEELEPAAVPAASAAE